MSYFREQEDREILGSEKKYEDADIKKTKGEYPYYSVDKLDEIMKINEVY